MNFINGFVSDALPLAPAVTPVPGVSQTAAREDHKHPTTVAETVLADYSTTTEVEALIAPKVNARMFSIAVANWEADDAIFKFTWSVQAKPAGATLIAVLFPNTTLDNIQSEGIVVKEWGAGGLVLNRPTATTEPLEGHLLWL